MVLAAEVLNEGDASGDLFVGGRGGEGTDVLVFDEEIAALALGVGGAAGAEDPPAFGASGFGAGGREERKEDKGRREAEPKEAATGRDGHPTPAR